MGDADLVGGKDVLPSRLLRCLVRQAGKAFNRDESIDRECLCQSFHSATAVERGAV
jgi:hypothetical protein